ncbi:unnamed protein product, partial [marine sediment metagenome]
LTKKGRANKIANAIVRLAIIERAMALKKMAIEIGVSRKQYHSAGNNTR